MAVKLVVLYPRPNDVEAFERLYNRVYAPVTADTLPGKTVIVANKVVGTLRGVRPYHRIVEIHFPSMGALQECAASKACKRTLTDALMSSGGAPTILIVEEETFVFDRISRQPPAMRSRG